MCDGFCDVEVFETPLDGSPKSQTHETGLLVLDVELKFTFNGTQPLVGSATKFATGQVVVIKFGVL